MSLFIYYLLWAYTQFRWQVKGVLCKKIEDTEKFIISIDFRW